MKPHKTRKKMRACKASIKMKARKKMRSRKARKKSSLVSYVKHVKNEST